MAKTKWYTPQLSRVLVSRLYHRAKFERIPMTALANQLVEEALEHKKRVNTQRVAENQHVIEPN